MIKFHIVPCRSLPTNPARQWINPSYRAVIDVCFIKAIMLDTSNQHMEIDHSPGNWINWQNSSYDRLGLTTAVSRFNHYLRPRFIDKSTILSHPNQRTFLPRRPSIDGGKHITGVPMCCTETTPRRMLLYTWTSPPFLRSLSTEHSKINIWEGEIWSQRLLRIPSSQLYDVL